MKKRRPPSDAIRYTSAGIQMVLIIGLFVFAGNRLDNYTNTEKPWWTLGLSLFGAIVAIIYMVTAFNRISKK